jgi:hypothetical protein
MNILKLQISKRNLPNCRGGGGGGENTNTLTDE